MRTRKKGEYRKITTTVPLWAYGALIQESARRKISGEPDQLLSALLREAITDYLQKLPHQYSLTETSGVIPDLVLPALKSHNA